MDQKVKLVAATTLLGSQIANANINSIYISNLNEIGIDPSTISTEFQNQVGVSIDINEKLKVSFEDEGKNIRFETFDKISITVPIELAHGPYNKDQSVP